MSFLTLFKQLAHSLTRFSFLFSMIDKRTKLTLKILWVFGARFFHLPPATPRWWVCDRPKRTVFPQW